MVKANFCCNDHFASVGLVWTKDIDFGDPATCTLDSNKECLVDLKVDCTQQQDLTGFILSPNFPATMTSEQAGKVRKSKTSVPFLELYACLFLSFFLSSTFFSSSSYSTKRRFLRAQIHKSR